ncbi:unnamed protein product [Malus baccata var. baccata]
MVSPKRTISCYGGGTGPGCGGPGPGCEKLAFWELIGFGFRRNSEVKREGGQSTPRMSDPLRSCS